MATVNNCAFFRSTPTPVGKTPSHGARPTFSSIYRCHARSGDGKPGSGDGSDGAGSAKACQHYILQPLTGLRLHANDGMQSGIQFHRIDSCGVGIPSVLDMGLLDAVDVWSNIGSGFSVCFPQPGHLVFLDAATSPRSLVEVENVIEDGYTCAAMDRAGTMVLVNAPSSTTPQTSTTTIKSGTNDDVNTALPLENCEVTPRFNLRLRAAPWGRILDTVPTGMTVAAKARTESWFNVTYQEQDGWNAAWLTDSEGDCDGSDTDIADGDE